MYATEMYLHRLAIDKHSSLLDPFISFETKDFIELSPEQFS
jgi:hypothetical protein